MGKLAVAGATVLAGGGVSAGGVILSKMFSFDSTLPRTLDEFKKQKDDEIEGCVQNLFPGLQSMDYDQVNTSVSSSDKIQANFLDTNKKDKVSGCLVINGNKEQYKVSKNDKGKGDFRFLWAVQQESKGFIVFTTATAKNSNLVGKGVAYSLEKKDNKTWQLSKKKLVNSEDKKTGKSDINNKFPKPHSQITSKDFWGFMKDDNDMDKMCGESDCTGDPISSSFEGYWTWTGKSEETGSKLGDGTSNSGTDDSNSGWNSVFTKSEGDMNEVVKDMTGKWEKKVWSGIK